MGGLRRLAEAARRRRASFRAELTWLGVLLGAACGLLAFWLLAAAVLQGGAGGFDRAVLLALRDPADLSDPLGPRWVEEAARDVTALGSHAVLVPLTLAVAGFLALTRERRAAVFVLGAVGGGMALSSLLKLGFGRPRPDLVPHAVEVYTLSFPSGHAMLSAATFLTLGAVLMRVQPRRRVKLYVLLLAVLATLLVGASRVYLGVHWPTDVLAGWCAGAAWASCCWLAALWLQRRGAVETPRADGNDPAG